MTNKLLNSEPLFQQLDLPVTGHYHHIMPRYETYMAYWNWLESERLVGRDHRPGLKRPEEFKRKPE